MDIARNLKVIPKPTSSVNLKGKNPLLSDECVKVLSYRIQQEEYSSRLYLSMSMWLDNQGYKNSASLWKKYSEEELKHADFSREYLLSMGVQPPTPSLDAPGDNYTGLPEIIKLSYQHEIDVTKQCKELCDAAFKAGDHMLYTLGLKYVAEQIEEHSKMQDLLDQLNAFGEDKIALRLLDNALGD